VAFLVAYTIHTRRPAFQWIRADFGVAPSARQVIHLRNQNQEGTI